VHGRLRIFISSTADLALFRDAAERGLRELDIDGDRFEEWPSTPSGPIAECLRGVDSSDALILILGDRYGTEVRDGLSATHLEYRRAIDHVPPKPVFAYVLPARTRESKQCEFVAEVERKQFRSSAETDTPARLSREVRRSLLAEFAKCFRNVHPGGEPIQQPSTVPVTAGGVECTLPSSSADAYPFLHDLYVRGDDEAIFRRRAVIRERFSADFRIMNTLHMATTNIAMAGGMVGQDALENAIAFWDSEAAARMVPAAGRLYNQGNALGVLGRGDEAIQRYEEALQANSGFAQCWKNLGSELEKRGEIEKAESCYRRALECDGTLFEALLAMGQLMLRRRHAPREALDVLNRVAVNLLTSRDTATVEGWKALAHLELGDYRNAVAHIEEAARALPSAEWVWKQAARTYALAGRDDRDLASVAAAFWRRYTARFPRSAPGWGELGLALWRVHRQCEDVAARDEAADALQRATELGSNAGLIWDRLGHIRQERGELDLAEAAFREAARKNPAFVYCLGVCLIAARKYPEALPLLLRDAESINKDARSWFQVGVCHAELGNGEEAKLAYAKAIRRDPVYPHAWYNLGGQFWNEGDLHRAVQVWLRAIRRFPEFERADEVRSVLLSLGADGSSH